MRQTNNSTNVDLLLVLRSEWLALFRGSLGFDSADVDGHLLGN